MQTTSPPLLPAELREKKLGPEADGEKIDKFDPHIRP